MARRGNRRSNSMGPIIGAIALAAFVAAAVTMVATGNRAGGAAGIATDIGGSVGRVVSAPVRWVQGGWSSLSSFFGGSTLNAKLKAENASLLQWRDQVRSMAERLDAYEKLNGVAGERIPQGLTGRMIGESGGTFSHAGIVNLGSKAGVEVNWIVINQNGLVGRVIAVGSDTSRVLLLADADSRVPVMGETTRARAIATGDKTVAPRLSHLNTPAIMQDGERVMTSGDDGIFPRGIAVGQAGIAPDQLWHVRLASSRTPIDFVRLIPPSNFPPPLDPVTPPPLTAPPEGASATVSVLGGLLPLAPGAAPVPTAATPEAIRAAQTDLARKAAQQAEATKALNKKLIEERDAAREAVRKSEAARLAAERRIAASAQTQETKSTKTKLDAPPPKRKDASSPPKKKLDPDAVPIAPSALNPAPPEPKKAPDPAPVVEGPAK
jgi:rod shape-determining protein MreC